ncbi:hypothetical protein QBC43DRAFT_360880 [Cladorrhinum sp. PSN259]|nr:hypothetical protein QBC43DRAFT_360880 [Cladorrhinum sp. PSN259]
MSQVTPIVAPVLPPIPVEEPKYSGEAMQDVIRRFKEKKIPVYVPGEDDYERYTATANLIYRFSNPPCVVQPKCACDVRDIVRIAKTKNIPIRIKNGGHSYAGGSTTNIGILMELGLMREVNLDKESCTVTVKAGALWFNVYKKLVSERLDGWVANGGRCPTVGVSGFMLGGGLSPFTRSFGMGCDTVKEFTVVTADGDEVTASEERNTDLFWALRGAGGGNFGVVVEMKLALQKLATEYVVAGRYTWSPKAGATDAFMATMNSFYTRDWPDAMTIDSSWLCELGNTKPDIAVRFLVYYNGRQATFDKVIDDWTLTDAPKQHAELKEQLEQETLDKAIDDGTLTDAPKLHAELKEQLKQRSLEEKSTRFLHETLAAQWIEETKKSFPTNRSYQIYTSFVFKNEPNTIKQITQVIRERMQLFREKFKGETALLQVTFIHSGGAAAKHPSDYTAFPWRECVYHTYIMIQWDEKWLEKGMRLFLQDMKVALSPFGMVQGATFINFADDTLVKTAHEKSYYGDNYHQLRHVKEQWDKQDFFRWPQGIQLPGSARAEDGADGCLFADHMQFVVNEESLTDVVATQQWETYRPPSPTDFNGLGFLFPALFPAAAFLGGLTSVLN